MRIALVSLNQIWENKRSNLDLCEKYIQIASEHNIDLIIFPEMTLTGFSNNIDLVSEKFESSETIKSFSTLAKRFKVGIVFGLVVKNANKGLNKSILMDNNGEILGDYSKIHPFCFADEDKYFNAGNKLCINSFKGIKVGLTICYDLRFPELYSGMAKDCDLIINIANWPAKRIEHWSTLLKARAIENQIFMVGVNRTGTDGNGLEYIESSNVFNANGEIVKFNEFKEIRMYDIDVNWTKEFKNKFNTTNDRKIELYKEIL